MPSRLSLVLLFCVGAAACSSSPGSPVSPTTSTPQPPGAPAPPSPPAGPPTWDIDTKGVPKFITHDYIDLDRIASISRFRSVMGHDYSDDFETCRSMKHYFRPAGLGAATIAVFVPVAGEIFEVRQEWAGMQIVITPDGYPAFIVTLFHVNPTIPVSVGMKVTAGQLLGTHVSDQTMSDVAIRVATPTGMKLVSWFDAMTDTLFDGYRARGVSAREAMIITRAQRDADPLTCDASGLFLTRGSLADWVDLR